MKKLTVKEIAKMAGVSVTAVSFVLNDKPGVSDETRENVRRIIKETGFKPNQSSKKLVLSKSFNICIMMNSFSSPFEDLFYFEITRGILNRSLEYNYNIVISKPVNADSELPDMIYSGDADGMIFMQDISPSLLEKAIASGVPFVIVDAHSSSSGVTSINPDYLNAARTATSYLIQHGHTDIAMIASETVPEFYKQTLTGVYAAMEEHNILPNSDFFGYSATNEDTAYEAAKQLFSKKHRPTAVVCTVDSFAIGAMRCAKDMNLSIPHDVSFIGIDDIMLSRYIEPKLTTIGIDKVEMGALAMELLLRKIKGKNPRSVRLPMDLIVRDSVRDIRK